jgi:flagellar M-ring protein FliF
VGGALGANGVFGVDGTSTTGGTTGDGSTYVKKSSTTDNANNVVVDNTVVAPGDVERQSVAVVVDQKSLDAIGQANLQTMVTTAAGFDQNRGDVVSVTPATFDTTAKDAADAALKKAAAEQKSEEQFALIKQGAIALGVLLLALVLFIAWRRAVKKGKREAVDIGELERLYPEVPVAAGQAGPGLALPTANDAHLLTAPEPEPEALRRQEFGQLVDTQPAEVANLLRGWLAASKKG